MPRSCLCACASAFPLFSSWYSRLGPALLRSTRAPLPRCVPAVSPVPMLAPAHRFVFARMPVCVCVCVCVCAWTCVGALRSWRDTRSLHKMTRKEKKEEEGDAVRPPFPSSPLLKREREAPSRRRLCRHSSTTPGASRRSRARDKEGNKKKKKLQGDNPKEWLCVCVCTPELLLRHRWIVGEGSGTHGAHQLLCSSAFLSRSTPAHVRAWLRAARFLMLTRRESIAPGTVLPCRCGAPIPWRSTCA